MLQVIFLLLFKSLATQKTLLRAFDFLPPILFLYPHLRCALVLKSPQAQWQRTSYLHHHLQLSWWIPHALCTPIKGCFPLYLWLTMTFPTLFLLSMFLPATLQIEQIKLFSQVNLFSSFPPWYWIKSLLVPLVWLLGRHIPSVHVKYPWPRTQYPSILSQWAPNLNPAY